MIIRGTYNKKGEELHLAHVLRRILYFLDSRFSFVVSLEAVLRTVFVEFPGLFTSIIIFYSFVNIISKERRPKKKIYISKEEKIPYGM